MPTKNLFFIFLFLCLLLFEGTFTSFSKIKSQKGSHKAERSKVFLLFLLGDRRIRIQEAQKHVDPVDPDPDSDPQHCLLPTDNQQELKKLLFIRSNNRKKRHINKLKEKTS
jgi:hypothetical protein